jgi:hypothetical protein
MIIINEINISDYVIIFKNLIEKYPILREKSNLFINIYPDEFIFQELINLCRDIDKYGNFLELQDNKLFEILVFGLMELYIQESRVLSLDPNETLWKSKYQFNITNMKLQIQILNYLQQYNLDKKYILQQIQNISFKYDTKSDIWNSYLSQYPHILINDNLLNNNLNIFKQFIFIHNCIKCGNNFVILYKNLNKLPKLCNICKTIDKKNI